MFALGAYWITFFNEDLQFNQHNNPLRSELVKAIRLGILLNHKGGWHLLKLEGKRERSEPYLSLLPTYYPSASSSGFLHMYTLVHLPIISFQQIVNYGGFLQFIAILLLGLYRRSAKAYDVTTYFT